MQADWLWGIRELVSWCRASSLPETKCISLRVAVNSVSADGVFGGAEGTRTPDPLLAKEVLSQLSYGPTCELSAISCQRSAFVVGDGGLEPPTSVLSGPRSNQLS